MPKNLFRFVERVYYWEGYFGRRADLNLCVTHAMRQDMCYAWDIHSATLYDRPPSWSFHKLNKEEYHQFFLNLSQSNFDDFKSFIGDPKANEINESCCEGIFFLYCIFLLNFLQQILNEF